MFFTARITSKASPETTHDSNHDGKPMPITVRRTVPAGFLANGGRHMTANYKNVIAFVALMVSVMSVLLARPSDAFAAGSFAITSPLSLSASSVAVGGSLTGTVTVQNQGNTTLSLNAIVISARPPSGQYAPGEDFGGAWSVTLSQGQSLTIQKMRAFTTSDPTGTWTAFVGYQTTDGVWHTDPTTLQFTVQAASAPSAGPIALGADISDQGTTASASPWLIDWYANLVGRMPAIVSWGQDWVHSPTFSPTTMDSIRTRGSMPLVAWMPEDASYSNGAAQPPYKLSNITRGDFDGYIRQWATDARNWGHPFYLRFAQEMNGNWYVYGTAPGNPDGNTPADFVAAWHHVHDIFTQVGATNVRWVWCVNDTDPGWTPYAQDYPGDNYVDWVSIDSYNYGTTQPWSSWRSVYQTFAASYAEMTALTSKPIIIGETASLEQGGSKADWITQGFLQTIPNSFPRIRAVVWYDENNAHGDYRVNSSSTSLSAWKTVVASPLYQGTLP